jgi:3-oxoacyl-[acyl-carrier protein] reductase
MTAAPGNVAINLQGRVAIVTGATRSIGIGAAIARALAQAGAAVFFTYYRPYDASMPWGHNQDDSARLLAQLLKLGQPAACMEINLAVPSAAPTLFDQVEAELGPAHILVNNAAHSTNEGIDQLTAETLDRHYALNVRGMALLCAEFVRRFRPLSPNNPGGRIINISSGQGLGPMPGELAYVASKGAVEAFTVSLSAEVAARGITANAVDPGATDTGWMTPELQGELTAKAPMGRLGQPMDAARLVRFLASDEAAWLTGQVIHSRGGT